MAEKASPGLQPLGRWYMSIEEVALITGGLGHLYSAGNSPSHISRGNASEEVQVVDVGGLQATSDRAAGVIQH